jgi:prepilin peptidase CpaA
LSFGIIYISAVGFIISKDDVLYRKIYNVKVGLMLIGCLYISIINQSIYFESVLMMLGIGLVLGVLRVVAFGDVKLAAAMAVGVPIQHLLITIWQTLIFGGVVTIVVYLSYRIFNRGLSPFDWGVPYGVAIVFGFITTYINIYN